MLSSLAMRVRARVVAIAISIAFGSVDGASSRLRAAEEQSVSDKISSKRMVDGKEWTTANLNVEASPSYCYEDFFGTVCPLGSRDP